MTKPRFPDDPAFRCLRVGDLDGYHRAIEGRAVVDFTGTDLRASDFRRADLSRVVLRDAYLRDADFRGCDLRHLDLEGASIQAAKLSGVYFPANLSPEEICMSIRFGTRLRTNKS
jgi:uncharacterized protein YjbI with pentapeptide repeats